MPTKFLGVVARGCAVVAVAALALVGCDRGDTAVVTQLTDISATLHGTINSSEPATQTPPARSPISCSKTPRPGGRA